ncbi:phage tail protein [Vagococcus vulneris]|uniref:Uncharacterized protein n=1 Tax=Vagococcus vulneris TaxID=1977869 RepID=A0A429ZWT0_9ENTE|nr:phage tail protein [Vagococcus vulneris]RST98257.1 hypothetical protein CBF37_08050 [Vagococcus vulneris]
MYVRSIEGKEYPLMSTYTVDDEINGNISIAMDIVANKPNSVFIEELSEFWELVDDDDEVYRIVYCKKQGFGNNQFKTIRAIPKLYDIMDSTRIYQRFDGSYSVAQLFEAVFEPTDYDYTLVGSWNNIRVQGYGDGETCLAMFQKVLERIKAEFTFTGKVVTIREKIGTDKDVMYRYRLNASNISHEVDGQEFYTFERGYGDFEDEGETGWQKAKLIREYTSPLAKIIGKREGPPIKNGTIKHADTMDRNLKALVDNSIKISVTADLVDLRKKNYPYAVTNLGDTVWLIDERIQLEEQVRVVKRSIKYDWRGNILDLQFTFGSQGIVDRYNGKLSNAVNTINDILAGKTKLPFSAMSNEIQIVTKILKNVQTQLKVDENGSILAINKKDPNQLVIFNAAGLGVSDDGGKTFKSAITGRGIYGDVIIANTIKVDALEANWVQVGFNKYSDNIEIFGDRFDFYDSKHQLTATINADGHSFYNGKRFIGGIGETAKSDNLDVVGLALSLGMEGDYMTLQTKTNAEEPYWSMLTVDPRGKYAGRKGIYTDLPLYMNGDIGMRGSSGRLLSFDTVNYNGSPYPSLVTDDGRVGILFGTGYLYFMYNSTVWSFTDVVKAIDIANALKGKSVVYDLKDTGNGGMSWSYVNL